MQKYIIIAIGVIIVIGGIALLIKNPKEDDKVTLPVNNFPPKADQPRADNFQTMVWFEIFEKLIYWKLFRN